MPLPTPLSNESQDIFIDRCMNDPTAQEEFPEGDQRLAVCLVQWEDEKGITKEDTDFPQAGDNLEVSLRNSNYSQPDWGYVNEIKEEWPEIWEAGGNTRGNEAYQLWTTARQKTAEELTDGERDWIREREAWAARHYENFQLAGVVAQLKWGVVGSRGFDHQRDVIEEEKDRLEEKSMKGNKKVFSTSVKQIGDPADRTLRFIASDESEDRDGDVIRVAGWKTDNFMKNPVFLYIHDGHTLPIGKGVKVVKDTVNKQLLMDVKFPTIEELTTDMNVVSEHAKLADLIYNMYLNGYMNAVSVGFNPDMKSAKRNVDGIRGWEFNDQDLLELSAVPIPSNPNALQQAKNFGSKDVCFDLMIDFQEYEKSLTEEIEEPGADNSKDIVIDTTWCDSETSAELAEKCKKVALKYGVDVKRIVVDGKESTVSALDSEDKGIISSFNFFKTGNGSLTIDSKYLNSKSSKKDAGELLNAVDRATEEFMQMLQQSYGKAFEKRADPNGNPSAWDIEMAIDRALPNGMCSIDIFPARYPSGHASVVDWDQDIMYLAPYEWNDGEVTVGEMVEIEIRLDFKSLKNYKENKAGARNSTKDIQTLTSAIDHMKFAMDEVNSILEMAVEEDEQSTDDDTKSIESNENPDGGDDIEIEFE